MADVLHDVVEPVHRHLVGPAVDAAVRGGADGDVIARDAVELEELLHGDADGRTAPPDGDDEARLEAARHHPGTEPECVLQQALGTEVELLGHGGRVTGARGYTSPLGWGLKRERPGP